jgi:hypothetical protein
MRTHLLLSIVLCACAAPSPSVGGPVATDPPPPLTGAARELVLAALCEDTGSLPERRPDADTASTGQRVPYDHYLLRGSSLQQDRVRALDEFVDELVAKGGRYYALHLRADGRPGKILVVVDGLRVIVSRQEW